MLAKNDFNFCPRTDFCVPITIGLRNWCLKGLLLGLLVISSKLSKESERLIGDFYFILFIY